MAARGLTWKEIGRRLDVGETVVARLLKEEAS
jgi:DNA-binding transcriptional regulator LsrR (DeoR family)